MILNNMFFTNQAIVSQKGEMKMKKIIATLFVLGLIIAMNGLVGCCVGGLSYSAPAKPNAIYSVYHVEVTEKHVESGEIVQVGYAMVKDPIDTCEEYKVIFISNVCLKTYRPDANILRIGESRGMFCETCEWLKTENPPS